jgi:hypothetical protein
MGSLERFSERFNEATEGLQGGACGRSGQNLGLSGMTPRP